MSDAVDLQVGASPVARHVLDSPEATQRIIRGGIARTGAYFAGLLASLAALPLLFRHLGVVDAGRYATVLSVVGIVGGIVESGLSAVSVREYSLHNGDEGAALMRDLIGMRMGLFAAATGVTLAFLVVAGYPSILIAGAAIALVGAALDSLASVYSVWLSTTLHLTTMAVMQVVRSVAATVLTLVLVLLHAPLLSFFVLLIVAAGSQLAIAVWATRGAIPHRPSLHVRSWWAFVRPSLPYIVAMGLGVVYLRIAMLLMALLASDQQTGYFGVPFRLLEIVTLVSTVSLSSAFPILARAATSDPERHRYALRRLIEVASMVGGAVAVGSFAGASVLVHILAGTDFDPSITILRIMAISLAAKFVISAWAFSLLSVQAYTEVLRANAAALLVAVVLTVIAVPLYGGIGGAVAIAGADLVLVLGYALALHRYGFGVGMPKRSAIVIVVAAVVATLVVLPIPASDAARAVIAVTLYVALLLVARVVPPEILGLLPRLRGRKTEAAA